MDRVRMRAVNRLDNTPILSVTANPLTGPVPNFDHQPIAEEIAPGLVFTLHDEARVSGCLWSDVG